MYSSTKFQSIQRNPDYGTKFAQKTRVTKVLEKINIEIVIKKHIAMYPCTKFQLIWITSSFGTKFAQKNVDNKILEK